MVFDLLINALVFGSGYRRIAVPGCSATTSRRRRDEWIAAGVTDRLEQLARDGYDKMIGLQLEDLAVNGCVTKAPCGGEVAGRNPADRGKLGIEHSTVTDAAGPLLGVVSAPSNRHDSPLLAPTLDILKHLGPLQQDTSFTRTPDMTPTSPEPCWPTSACSPRSPARGSPPPLQATKRWVVERTHAWHHNFYRLARCTERRQVVADFYIALASAIILVRRLCPRQPSTRPSRWPLHF